MDTIIVDLKDTKGYIKKLHGANNGPVCYGALVNVSDYYKEIGFPTIRLHDTNWPNPGEVDIHTIFPNFDADPEYPENYDFRRTDVYIKSIIDTGATIIYRLGTSIEHTEQKYFIHPPRDFSKWAKICLGIIRHYNEGWANGFYYHILYWEIWNEPEGMPITGSDEKLRLMWSGTNEEYLALYRTAAIAIKNEFPAIKVGGFSATMTDIPFIELFFERCKAEKIPLDFFTWHKYDIDPENVASSIKLVRSLLDKYELYHTESHLNEWNYTRAPEGVTEFSQMFGQGNEYNTQEIFDRLCGPEGASYDTALLIKMQDLPIDMANFYDAAPASFFSLFNRYGVPQKNYYAFKAFSILSNHPNKLEVEVNSGKSGLYCCAGSNDENNVALLISNFSESSRICTINFKNIDEKSQLQCNLYLLDENHNLEPEDSYMIQGNESVIRKNIGAYTVLLLKISKENIY